MLRDCKSLNGLARCLQSGRSFLAVHPFTTGKISLEPGSDEMHSVAATWLETEGSKVGVAPSRKGQTCVGASGCFLFL